MEIGKQQKLVNMLNQHLSIKHQGFCAPYELIGLSLDGKVIARNKFKYELMIEIITGGSASYQGHKNYGIFNFRNGQLLTQKSN